MGGCYNASLSTMVPNKPGLPQEPQESAASAPAAPAAPAAPDAASGEAAAAFRRRGRRMRKAAFGANKAVSCTGGIGDILKSLSTKDAPCTLATLHRLVHTFMIIVGLVGVLRRIIPAGQLKALVMPLFTLVLVSVTLSNYSPKEFRRDGDHFLSRIVELVLLILYLVPALSKVIVVGPQLPIVTPVAKGVVKFVDDLFVSRVRALIAAVPGLGQVSQAGLQ